jgi:L-threonate 2-dehydrogenase
LESEDRMSKPVIVVVATGEMGAAVAGRLRAKGAEVRTSLTGRSPASARRAQQHGLIVIDDDGQLVHGADFVLSIVPPAEAVPIARRLAPAIRAAGGRVVFVECNAINPATAQAAAAVIAPTGARFVDAGIIGGPPHGDGAGPKFYASGTDAVRFAELRDYGLDVRPMSGEIGAASGLKMAYGSLTKGVTAIGISMMLSASAFGVDEVLKRELEDSQPQLKALLERSVPRSLPKAYRWVAEMEEIAKFIGKPASGGQMFDGVARLYETVARSFEQEGPEIATLKQFVRE